MTAELLCTDPVSVARLLLGAVLTVGSVSARVVETEAYGGPPDGPWPDASAHSYRGPTPRNAVMFGPPGRLYTYRSHGIHVCANVSCGPDGAAAAVLLRAAVIDSGHAAAITRRGEVPAEALARGPGNLCSALGITMDHNGADILDSGSPVRLTLVKSKGRPCAHRSGPRVGVSRAADRPWRFWIPDSAAVSIYRRSPRAPGAGGSD